MLVREYMIKHPPMVSPDLSLVEAQHYMSENNFHHVPVVKDGKRLVGLLTRQTLLFDFGRLTSLNVWDITRQLSNLKVQDVMLKARDVITIDPDTPIEQAARVMVEHQVGCLPVVGDGIVVGLITKNDLLTQLSEMMAGQVSGVRITIQMPMIRGELAKLVSVIAGKGWGIETMGGVLSPKDPTKWNAVVKIRGPRDEVVAALSTIEGQKILDAREV